MKYGTKHITILLLSLMSVALQGQQTSQTINDMIAPYHYPVKYHDVDDSTQVAYIDEGQGGKTLLFIHGLATYLPAWHTSIEAFKKDYRCIAVDLPGYGRSSKGDYPATMSYYAGVINKLVGSLGLKNVTLVGHSMGGQVALTSVLTEPEMYRELILLASAGFETFKEPQKNWLKSVFTPESVFHATEEQIRANWKLNFYNMPESVEFMIKDRLSMKEAVDFEAYCRSVARGVAGMLDEPVFDRLKEVPIETLVVYGENDRLIPNAYLNPGISTRDVARAGVAEMPKARLEIIAQCGHFISFDKPDKIHELMRTFLTR